jgi:hypothetical protein
VLRGIFLHEGDEVTGRLRKLHNEKFSSPCIVRAIKSRMEWATHVALMDEIRIAYKILVGNPEGNTKT